MTLPEIKSPFIYVTVLAYSILAAAIICQADLFALY